jgi:hypothetical protein
MSSRLPLLPDQCTPGYPPKGTDTPPTVQYFALSDILTRAWTTDAHTTAYSVEAWPYRLSKAAIDLDGGVLMVVFIADVDCEQSHAASGGQEDMPAPDHWWLQELDKVEELQHAYPRAFIYRTRGGYRVVYVLPNPRCLRSPADVDAWKADYLAWVAALRLRFRIYADPACQDWQRLYRVPHATRSRGGRPEARDTLGSPYDIGLWNCEPTMEKRELAKTLAKRPRTQARPAHVNSSVNAGDGVFFYAFKARGWIDKAIEAGKWNVHCPWDDQHTKGKAFDGSTVLYAPGAGHTLGWLHCSHAHCQHRDSRDVLGCFSREELSAAEREAGVPPFTPQGTNGRSSSLSDTDDSAVSGEKPSMTLQEVVAVFQRWLHLPDPGPLYAVLGTYAANRMAGDPLWMMLIGGSGWGKTELLMSLTGLPHVHVASTMTEASLLSGTSRRDKGKDATGGLLQKIGIGQFGCLLCKDFTSVLSMNREASTTMLAALREIFDGSWTRHVGIDGGKTLHWEGKLALIAGCTGAIDRYHAIVGALGERFLSYRLQTLQADQQCRRALDLAGYEKTMRQELAGAVTQLFNGLVFPERPTALKEDEKDSLIALATLAARCRSSVIRDIYRFEIELILDPEAPARMALSLLWLYAGMRAVGVAAESAKPLIMKVGLDCMPAIRRAVFSKMVGDEQKWETAELATQLGYPTQTTRRTLEDLTAHGIVIRQKNGKADQWNLSDLTYGLY